jgi:hypothetical protein
MTTSALRFSAAVVLGAAYLWSAVTFWGFYAVANPITPYLLDALARNGHGLAYSLSVSVHDIVVNIVIALPFAAVFMFFHSLRHWVYVVIAAVTAVACSFAFFTSWEGLPLILSSWGFWLGVGMTALSLPLAFAVLSKSRFGRSGFQARSNAA